MARTTLLRRQVPSCPRDQNKRTSGKMMKSGWCGRIHVPVLSLHRLFTLHSSTKMVKEVPRCYFASPLCRGTILRIPEKPLRVFTCVEVLEQLLLLLVLWFIPKAGCILGICVKLSQRMNFCINFQIASLSDKLKPDIACPCDR